MAQAIFWKRFTRRKTLGLIEDTAGERALEGIARCALYLASLGDESFGYDTGDVGEAEVAAGVVAGELFVVETEQVQDCGGLRGSLGQLGPIDPWFAPEGRLIRKRC